jgi:hypothetical protein
MQSEIERASTMARRVVDNVQRVLVGKQRQVEYAVAAATRTEMEDRRSVNPLRWSTVLWSAA